MAAVFLVEQQADALLVGGGDLIGVDREAIAAPAVRRRDHRSSRPRPAAACSWAAGIGEHVRHVGELVVVDRLGQALLGVEARPEAVGHHQVEVLGAAGAQLVVGLRVAVEEAGRDLDAVLLLEGRGQLLDVVVLPAEPAQLEGRGPGVPDERKAERPGGRRGRARLEQRAPREGARLWASISADEPSEICGALSVLAICGPLFAG